MEQEDLKEKWGKEGYRILVTPIEQLNESERNVLKALMAAEGVPLIIADSNKA